MKGQVSWFERMAFLAAHPVKSFFWTDDAENPGVKYGGTWQMITGVFLLAAGGSYAVGSTGGEEKHTLMTSEMPSHTHAQGVYVHGYNGWNSLTVNSYGVAISYNSDNYINPGETLNATRVPVYCDTDSSGGSSAHNNMPPYRATYCWQRTA